MNRTVYLFKRLLMGVPVVPSSLTVTFLILYLGPLDPVTAILGMNSDPETGRRIAVDLGLRYADGTKVPLWEQYITFVADVVTLNFGESWVVPRNTPVTTLVANRMPATLWLGFWSVVVALVIGIPPGVYAGLNANTMRDYAISAGGISWRAMPNFWLAVLLSGLLSSGGVLALYRKLGPDTIVVGTPNSLDHLFWGIVPFEAVPLLNAPWLPMPNAGPFLSSLKWILPAALVLGSASMANEVRIGQTASLRTRTRSTSRPPAPRASPSG